MQAADRENDVACRYICTHSTHCNTTSTGVDHMSACICTCNMECYFYIKVLSTQYLYKCCR